MLQGRSLHRQYCQRSRDDRSATEAALPPLPPHPNPHGASEVPGRPNCHPPQASAFMAVPPEHVSAVIFDISEALVAGGSAFQRAALLARLPLDDLLDLAGELKILVGDALRRMVL